MNLKENYVPVLMMGCFILFMCYMVYEESLWRDSLESYNHSTFKTITDKEHESRRRVELKYNPATEMFETKTYTDNYYWVSYDDGTKENNYGVYKNHAVGAIQETKYFIQDRFDGKTRTIKRVSWSDSE